MMQANRALLNEFGDKLTTSINHQLNLLDRKLVDCIDKLNLHAHVLCQVV